MSPGEWEKHKVLYSEIFNDNRDNRDNFFNLRFVPKKDSEIFNDNRDNRDNFFSSEILLPRKNVVSIVSIVVKKRVGVICLV